MKKLIILLTSLSILISSSVFAESSANQTTVQVQQQQPISKQQLQKAALGCQKPIGFFPTPSKLVCLLTAIGQSEKDIKPKAMAIIFSSCQGRLLQPQPAGSTAKKYPTLGACLQDPAAIEVINRELAAQGFNPISVVNPSVLSSKQ